MDDLISRQEAIEAMKSISDSICEQQAIDALCDLPSAQPEKRTHERTETHACDLISRKSAIDALNVGAELLRRVLDDADIVGAERAKYEWGLGLIESYISDMKEIPSAQPEQTNSWCINSWCNNCKEIVRCKNCKYNSNTCGNYVNCDIIPQMFGRTVDNFCSRAERRTDG